MQVHLDVRMLLLNDDEEKLHLLTEDTNEKINKQREVLLSNRSRLTDGRHTDVISQIRWLTCVIRVEE